MLPSYSTFASVTVARWILDLSMVRIMKGSSSLMVFARLRLAARNLLMVFARLRLAARNLLMVFARLRLAARNLRLLRVQYAVVDQSNRLAFTPVRRTHEHGQREQHRTREPRGRGRERRGIAQLGVIGLGAR